MYYRFSVLERTLVLFIYRQVKQTQTNVMLHLLLSSVLVLTSNIIVHRTVCENEVRQSRVNPTGTLLE